MDSDMTSGRTIRVLPTPADLAQAAARFVADRAGEAIRDRGEFRIALSGGNTPRATYEMLASVPYRHEIDWAKVQVFFSDERFVSPESPDSDFHMAQETLLSKVPLGSHAVHPVPTVDISPGEAAALYTRTTRDVFGVGLSETPHFDLILLGMGNDGHTASLFPGTQALTDDQSLVAANFVQRLEAWRVTFTYRLINAARCVAFLVEGGEKATILRQVLTGADLPAARVHPSDGDLVWLIDEAAARDLSPDILAGRP